MTHQAPECQRRHLCLQERQRGGYLQERQRRVFRRRCLRLHLCLRRRRCLGLWLRREEVECRRQPAWLPHGRRKGQ